MGNNCLPCSLVTKPVILDIFYPYYRRQFDNDNTEWMPEMTTFLCSAMVLSSLSMISSILWSFFFCCASWSCLYSSCAFKRVHWVSNSSLKGETNQGVHVVKHLTPCHAYKYHHFSSNTSHVITTTNLFRTYSYINVCQFAKQAKRNSCLF